MMKRREELRIPDEIDYVSMTSLKKEEKEKLSKFKPKTLGEASRISGVRPISVVEIYHQSKRLRKDKSAQVM